MLPTLQGTNEFPKVDTYLFVGGPKHGQWLDVVENEPVHKVFCQPVNAPFPTTFGVDLSGVGPGFEVHVYVKREISAEDQDGTQYVRAIYVHQDCPNAETAQSFLIAALLADFIKGGRKVIDENGRNHTGP